MSQQAIVAVLSGVALGALLVLGWQRYARARAETEGRGQFGGPDAVERTPSFQKKSLAVFCACLALAVVAIGYSSLPRSLPAKGPQSRVPVNSAEANPALADVDTMISQLAARLERNPEDGEGFRMLGWAYLMTDRPAEALGPYRKAIALLPSDAGSYSGYGEALTAVNDGVVSDEAIAQFRKALTIDPADVRARYFAAKFDYQAGRKHEALDGWIALAGQTPNDAAWQADLRRDIDMVAADLGVDVADRLPPLNSAAGRSEMPVLDQQTIDAAGQLSAQDQEDMVDRMVDGLAARLAKNPKDPNGWERLIRSRMVRGEIDQASNDLKSARRALAGDSSGLSLVNATARELGVP